MELCIAAGELIKLEGGRKGLVLRCTSGLVWLTKGDGNDYLIPAGKPVTLARGESALVEALKPSELRRGEPSAASDILEPVIGLALC
jgi:hypothetical protein